MILNQLICLKWENFEMNILKFCVGMVTKKEKKIKNFLI